MCKTFLLSFLITISTLGLVSRAHARPGDLDRTFGTQGRVLLQGYNAE